MPRSLATARGPRAKKIAGVNHKLLSSAHINRMSAKSKTPRPRSDETVEKIFQYALEENRASDENKKTENDSQPPKEDSAGLTKKKLGKTFAAKETSKKVTKKTGRKEGYHQTDRR
ncbi:hypothetical protein B0T20DRAFT_389769 [Sordaria brevicollis]|uniref:Uncharacterized protein n=1 Tax=Sordaria brevicollis TaxID=83679 RepID=A0AAE0UF08_SORBR|nr:hypothetical protein B0T20DRAFT_389769 [Sordaria brevicollis]